MRRRDILRVLGGAAVSWPVALRAQQQPRPVIGFVNAGFPEAARDELQGFLKGLGETGYVEGHNVTIEYRWPRVKLIGYPR